MTSRAVVVVDRIATLLLGLTLVIVGSGAFAWHQGYLKNGPFAIRSDQVRSPWMSTVLDASWWPWAAGASGLVLATVALIWIARHVTGNRVGRLRLPGSGATGALRLDVGAAVAAAADELTADHEAVRSCRSRVVIDRGQLVAVLEPVLEPTAVLTDVQTATEAAANKLLTFVGRDDLTCRVALRVARREHTTTGHRVH